MNTTFKVACLLFFSIFASNTINASPRGDVLSSLDSFETQQHYVAEITKSDKQKSTLHYRKPDYHLFNKRSETVFKEGEMYIKEDGEWSKMPDIASAFGGLVDETGFNLSLMKMTINYSKVENIGDKKINGCKTKIYQVTLEDSKTDLYICPENNLPYQVISYVNNEKTITSYNFNPKKVKNILPPKEFDETGSKMVNGFMKLLIEADEQSRTN